MQRKQLTVSWCSYKCNTSNTHANTHFPFLLSFPSLPSASLTGLVMGPVRASPLAQPVLVVLGLVIGVWSLNPDDPNVCSHWER